MMYILTIKQRIKTSFSALAICCLWGCFGTTPSINTGHEGKPMPSMNLLLLDSSTNINTKTWAIGKPVALIDFSPNCPYCKALTQNIIDNYEKVSDIPFVFLSSFPLSDLKNYYSHYQLNKYSNITIAQDYDRYFGQYFKSPGVPCIAIYGKDRLLKQVLMGKVNATVIKDIALE